MISLKNVSKYYRSASGITMGLRKINLDFYKGEFVAITGESGSGKSTMLNVLSGSDTYEEGEMYLYGHPTSHYGKTEWELYRRDYISFIYQNYNLIDSYTCIDNVESAMLLKGISKKERREKAMKYLEMTGLTEQASHKATQLSSGQKQRLSIARALAKETDIIVADEPTGNLDTENGEAVIKILHELSKEKLVIIVTHNFEQVEQYATRKVRLFEGEVAEDIMLNGNTRVTEEEEVDMTVEPFKDSPLFMDKKQIYARMKELKENKKAYRQKRRDDLKKRMAIAWRFVSQNRTAQPKRSALIFAFFTCVMFAFFVFFGNLITSVDDATAKEYSKDAFWNGDNTRIEIAKLDGTVTTQADLEKMLKLDHVLYADIYDAAHDVNYFMYKGDDYDIKYGEDGSETLSMLDRSKFMKSELCLSEDDLIEGRLPENDNEIVLGENDKSLMGETVRVYINNPSAWDEDMYIAKDMKVVGITDAFEEQAFFNTDLCMQVSMKFDDVFGTLYVQAFQENMRGCINDTWGKFSEDEKDLERYDNRRSSRKAYKQNYTLYIINDELADDEVRLSSAFYDKFVIAPWTGMAEMQYSIYKDVLVKAEVDGKIVLKCADITGEETASGKLVIEVSRNVYNSIYGERVNGDNQMCLYIDDYAYTDVVIDAIKELGGYEAISVYKSGVAEYNYEMVMEKLQTVLISIAALLVVFVLGNFLVFMLMKIKKGDFIILKALGMQQKVASDINFMDMYTNILLSTTLVLVIGLILSLCGVNYIYNIFKFYRWYNILILYILGMLMAYMVARRFNRYLQKNDRITSLKEN